ncbi:MAG: glycosyltransferase family protein [Alphaproteobacteria bacterium]|nr:glycosyltransferase family protein [Alphaproteobacteria bacterium]
MAENKRIVATIEARMTSSRFPGKVLMEACGKPMLQHMIERLQRVPSLDGIVVATTGNDADVPIVNLAQRMGVGFFQGSEYDVLLRVLHSARAYDIDVIVEMTGDCPLIDPVLVEDCIRGYQVAGVDYVSNVLERTYPRGMDTQVFATEVLADVADRTDDPEDHEHVSIFIYSHPEIYSLKNMPGPPELTNPGLGLTLDTPEDLELIRRIFEILYPDNPNFTLADILAVLKDNPALTELNAHVRRKHA